MDYIYNSWCVQIDITSVCKKTCIYCTRYLGHVSAQDRYAMTPERFEAVLDSLEGWPNIIGIMGGEPLLHPQFRELVAIARRRVPKEKLHIWTSGLPGTPLSDPRKDPDLDSAFGWFHYNPHDAQQVAVCRHQPLTIAVDEAVPDKGMMWKLANDCWLPRLWCPSVTGHGAYFCEVAGPLDAVLYKGAHAWPIEPGWWKRPPEAFQEQVSKLCPRCGMCLPMERQHLIDAQEKFTPKLLEDFRAAGAVRLGDKHIAVSDKQFTNEEIIAAARDWYPTNYRDDVRADESLPESTRGVQVRLTPDPDRLKPLCLDSEDAFHEALERVKPLGPDEKAQEFFVTYKGMPFNPVKEPYPFVQWGLAEENQLYRRAMLLHFKQLMDEEAFAGLLQEPVTPETLLALGHRYRTLLAERRERAIEQLGRKLAGKEVYFWGHGVAYQRFKRYFAETKPRCFLSDIDYGQAKGMRVDGIPVRSPEELLRNGEAPLPGIMFTKEAHAGIFARTIHNRYSGLVEGELVHCLLPVCGAGRENPLSEHR